MFNIHSLYLSVIISPHITDGQVSSDQPVGSPHTSEDVEMSEVRPPGLLCRETPVSWLQLAPELSQVRGVREDPEPRDPCRGCC